MRQRIAALLVVAVLLVAVPAVGLAAIQDTGESAQAQDEQANETAPGQQLSGVVGVGQTELAGDLDQRAFGLELAGADSQEERAAIIDSKLGEIEERLNGLEQRKAELDERREAGEISEGRYNAEMARLAAESGTAGELTNRSARAAGELPEEVRSDRNIGPERVQQVADKANELRGPEVAERARGIAGENVGKTPMGENRTAGPPGERGGQPGDGSMDDDQPGGDRDDGTTNRSVDVGLKLID
ncbi:MAG: DUF7096 domain-containing protein [Natrialbaceae archaeon]